MSLKTLQKDEVEQASFFCFEYMKPYAEQFYKSATWVKTSKAYAKSVGGLCERCRSRGIVKAGELVHHITHISPENIHDESVTLNWDNLMLVCRDCHAELHKSQKRYKVDSMGRVTGRD